MKPHAAHHVQMKMDRAQSNVGQEHIVLESIAGIALMDAHSVVMTRLVRDVLMDMNSQQRTSAASKVNPNMMKEQHTSMPP